MTMRASIILDLGGNLSAQARKYESALGGMAARGARHMHMLRSSVEAAGRGLDSLGNRYTALLSGAAGVGAAKMVVDLQRRFTRLAIQANMADAAVKRLKREIYEVAQAPDIRVDPSEITGAVEAIVEKTGDLKFAQDNLRNLAATIQATGAAGAAVGEIFAEFQKQGIVDPRQVMEAMDVLNVQGKEGAFTLQNLAALGPRVITAYTAWGRRGPQAMREMGAALQLIRQGAGSSEQAATRFEAMLRAFQNPETLKALRRKGIQVFDPEALKKGQRMLRPINELMAEIVQKTNGDMLKLRKIFPDSEALQAFQSAVGEYARTGSVASLGKFMSLQADGTTTLRDSARAAHDAQGALDNLLTAWKAFADSSLTEPIQAAADALNALGSENTGKAIKWLAYGGMALGGLVLGRKAWSAGRGVVDMFRGGGGAAAAAGRLGGLGGLPLPLPVYVVNSRMSLMPGELGGGAAGEAGAAMSGRGGKVGRFLGRAGKWLGRACGVMAAGAAAYDVYDAWTDDSRSTGEKIKATGEAGGGLAGSLAGAKLGALAGTAVMPGVGTAVVGVLGGLVGWFAGKWGGGKMAEALTPESLARAVNEKEARLRIEVAGPARVTSLETSGFEADVDTGLQMGAH